MTTELFCLRILNMNRGSIHTRSFRCIHFSVFRYRWTKMALRDRKVPGAFEKRAPGIICGTIWGSFAGGDHLRGCTVLLLLISSLLLLYGAVVIPRPTRLMVLTGRSFNKSVLVKYTTPGLYIWYSLLMSLWNTAYFPFHPCFWFIWYLFL